MGDGIEDYASYYYLWHLFAIGALERPPAAPTPPIVDGVGGQACPVIDKTIWEEVAVDENRVVKVGLIDMGIASHHPNLEPKIEGGLQEQKSRVLWDEALDLASHRHGAKYGAITDSHREDRSPHLANILIGASPLETRLSLDPWEANTIQRLKNSHGVTRNVDTYNQSYATHGTACAGVVCGTSFEGDQFGQIGSPIVYYGVDPHSKIVPITTSISPDPEQLIAAFLYAHSINVDVILFPRDAADPLQMPEYNHVDKNEKTRLDNSGRIKRGWALFKKVIIEVSKDIPVVCAAGNDGRSELIYPASLADDRPPPIAGIPVDNADFVGDERNGIIAVGSVTYRGYRSGYSNYGPGLTVVAPSDDGEIYNRHQLRLDKKASYATDHWTANVHEHPDLNEIEFSAERLVTLDVPGPRGYAAGSRAGSLPSRVEAVDDPGGLYTEIGGTSGASAIVAGAVALIQRHNGTKLNGLEVKLRLINGEPNIGNYNGPNIDISDWYWQNQNSLQLDAVNGPPIPDPTSLFGFGGLISMRSLLGL